MRVADFSWQIAGPTCTRYLGAMGAEVIRIESNRRPDPYRERSISHFINQSKKSVTINLSEPRGIELAKEVIALSDVVIENFAPGVIERLGLGYEELRRVRPEIVMLSSAGLGTLRPGLPAGGLRHPDPVLHRMERPAGLPRTGARHRRHLDGPHGGDAGGLPHQRRRPPLPPVRRGAVLRPVHGRGYHHAAA